MAAFGRPSSRAGSWISPPPPTTASTKPAASAASAEQDQHGRRRVVHQAILRSGRPDPFESARIRMERDRVPAAVDDRDPVRHRGGRRRRRRHLRVRPPGRGAQPDHRVDLRDAGRARPRRSTRSSPRHGPGRGPLPPRRRRPRRARRRPRRHPGPLRGVRRRRLRGRRRPGPPRLHGRGADDRPAHARRGVRRRSWCSAGRPGTGCRGRARWSAALRARLAAVRARVAGRPRPRVVVLEWTDPPFAPGHWVPEMVEAAGGYPLLGRPGRSPSASPGRPSHAAAARRRRGRPLRLRPPGAQALADELVASGVLPAGVPVHAVDANAAWARPGTRLVDGVEELESVLYAVNRVRKWRAFECVLNLSNPAPKCGFLNVFHCQRRGLFLTILLWGIPPWRRVGQRMQ